MSGLLQSQNALQGLVLRLAKCQAIAGYGPGEPEMLAYAFSDIEESFRKFLDEQLPRLADPSLEGERLEDVLFEINEEFRHILYHLHEPTFFRCLEPTHDWLTLTSENK